MSLPREALRLAADPRSVQTARHWVAARFTELSRSDLAECAELGISELVTNALLHAGDPIAVRIRGTRAHPRVEVTDGSRQPPVPPVPPGEDPEGALTTYGRGLGIVARCSIAWGAALESQGKVVWFEPSAQPREDMLLEGDLFEAEGAEQPAPESSGETVPVRLLGVPVSTTLSLHRQYQDLEREVRLLSLAHADAYPVAKELAEALQDFGRVYPDGMGAALDRAVVDDDATIDIEVTAPAEASEVYERTLGVLDIADEFCRAERLLSLARTSEQKRFSEWLLGELVHQAHGRGPTRWAGDGKPEPEPSA